jgi:transposase
MEVIDMALQHRIAFLPSEAELVSMHLAVTRDGGRLTFIDASGPIFTCREDDEGSLRFAAVMLTEPSLGLATPTQVAKVLGRHRSRVHEYRQRYQEGGAQVLEVQRRGPRGASKLKGRRLARAQKKLDEGQSNRQAAASVGVSEGTIRKAIQERRLFRPERIPEASAPASVEPTGSTPRQRSDEDASCAGGVATQRTEERALAATGLLVEAPPRLEAAASVGKGGVLVALPALLDQGLVEVGRQIYGSLRNGYYGLNAMVLTFGLMALVRIKSAEGLTHYAPGEFGLLLGLDRAPEMKTVRRKLGELAGRGQAREFSRAFTERWAQQAPDALGYLYIDGHVRPYHGRTHALPKTHVQRRRLCMPATTDYWVNDAHGDPLMFVTAPANDGLLAMMEQELLPEIRKLASARRVTLIFDREGWSPKRFKKWKRTGFDVITYRKGKYRDWQRRCFKKVTVEVSGRRVTYLLAERMLRLSKGFRMREVRRLCDDGHQTSVVTTRSDLPIETVALRMFSRWHQENFFRYMRHEFALDHLPTTAVEPADPERSVPNPVVNEKKRELSQINAELTKAEQAYGQKAHQNTEQKVRTVRGFKISHAELGRKINGLRSTRERLEADIQALPKRVPVRDTMDAKPIVQLERERKILTDTFKMVAYRAETQLANLAGPLLPHRNDEARKFLRQVFELPADLLPDYEQGILLVRLHSMTTPRHNRALASLCGVLNDLAVCYPGTQLRLVLEATQTPTQS